MTLGKMIEFSAVFRNDKGEIMLTLTSFCENWTNVNMLEAMSI